MIAYRVAMQLEELTHKLHTLSIKLTDWVDQNLLRN